MNPFIRRIRAVLVFLLFLELCFWVGGFITQINQRLVNTHRATQDNSYKILCLGESMTMVGGENSYPSQLEKILNNNSIDGKKFKVINQGVGGSSTAFILQQLPSWLQRYKPNMVIAMIGALDSPADGQTEPKGYVGQIIKEIKLYQLAVFIKTKITEWLSTRIKKKDVQSPEIIKEPLDFFKESLSKQPEDIIKLYMLIILAEGNNRDDVAEMLYEKLLKENTDSMVNLWVAQKYGQCLIRMKKYEKFVSKMEIIPFASWTMEWVKGFCHGPERVELVRNTIERMVKKGVDQSVYGHVAACYQEAGQNDLAQIYLNKMGSKSSYYASGTRNNYKAIKEHILSGGMQPVFVQYPGRNIKPLLSIFENDMDKGKIIFVDNEKSFVEGIKQRNYDFYFLDRMFGDIGHATPQGNHLLATNIARAILKRIFNKELLAPAQ